MTDLEVIMADGHTKKEAEKYLHNGSLVLPENDFKKHFITYMKEWNVDEQQEIDKYRKMIDTKEAMMDWGIVNVNNVTYFIQYFI